MVLLLNVLCKMIVELYYFFKIRSQENLWSNYTYLKFYHKERKFSRCTMDQIKIGDLLVVKKGHVSPVDLLVLDTGITKQGIKQFMTIENKVNGKENITYKSSIRNFSEDRHIKEKITNFENAISIIPNLDIELTYLSPEFTSLEKDNIGTFKLIKDPKVSIIRGKNLLYCGSKIISSW